jgi:cytochrome c556
MRLLLLSCMCLTFAVGCAPKREVTPEQVQSLTTLTSVMDAQHTYADPLMAKRDQPAFSDAEFAQMVDASPRLASTSLKAKQFSKGPAFDELAARLHGQAEALGVAGQAKDAAAARASLSSMREICRECHSKFK